MNKIILSIVIIIVLGIAGYSFFGAQQTTLENAVPAPGSKGIDEMTVFPKTTEQTDQFSKSELIVESEVQPELETQLREFDIIARRFEFEPSTIMVNQGDTVKLNITSIDTVHGLAISEFGVNVTLPVGQTKTIEFVADKTGSFTMYCSVYCGSDHLNMKGTLMVK